MILTGFVLPARIRFYFLLICALVMGVVTVLYIMSLVGFLTRKRVSKLSLQFGSADDSKERKERNNLIIKGIIIALLWTVCMVVL